MTLLYDDDFNRTESGGIGRSGDYTPDGSVAAASVNGTEAVVAADGVTWWEWDGAPTAHGYYYFDFFVPADPGNQQSLYEIDTRSIDGYATYVAVWAVSSDGTWRVEGYVPDVTNPFILFSPLASTWYTLAFHLDAVGGMLRLKLWQRGEPEPEDWDAEAVHGAGEGAWTPYLGIEAGPSEANRLDNLIVSDVPYTPPTDPHFSLNAFIDGTFDITSDFSLDTLIKRTWLYPAEPTAPTITEIDSTSGNVTSNATLTLTVPGTVAVGDMVIASISWDRVGASDLTMAAPTGWLTARTTILATNDQVLSTFYTIWEAGMATNVDFVSRNGISVPFATAKAGGMTVLRGAAGLDYLEYKTQTAVTTRTSVVKALTVVTPTGSDPMYRENLTYYAVWGAGESGTTNFSYFTNTGVSASTLFAETAPNWASVFGIVWQGLYFNVGVGVFADPGGTTAPTFNQLFIVHAPPMRFTLKALLNVGGSLSLDAWVVAAELVSTHHRSGPHYGQTPDTNIILSSPLGTLSAGATLHEALRELDDLISTRERGE